MAKKEFGKKYEFGDFQIGDMLVFRKKLIGVIKKKYPQVTYIHQKNQGVSVARNRGIIETDCEWICFLDSDDTWHKNKIQKQKQKIKENSEMLFCHTNEIWHQHGKILNQQKKQTNLRCIYSNSAAKSCVIFAKAY